MGSDSEPASALSTVCPSVPSLKCSSLDIGLQDGQQGLHMSVSRQSPATCHIPCFYTGGGSVMEVRGQVQPVAKRVGDAMCWLTPVISPLGRQRLEDHLEF